MYWSVVLQRNRILPDLVHAFTLYYVQPVACGKADTVATIDVLARVVCVLPYRESTMQPLKSC